MQAFQFVLVMISTLAIVSSNALACGGKDLTDDQIISHPQLISLQNLVQKKYGQAVQVESIVRSKNEIINLEKNTVASAMCNANYINVYFKSLLAGDELKCMTRFEIGFGGQFQYNGIIEGVVCRPSQGAQQELLNKG